MKVRDALTTLLRARMTDPQPDRPGGDPSNWIFSDLPNYEYGGRGGKQMSVRQFPRIGMERIAETGDLTGESNNSYDTVRLEISVWVHNENKSLSISGLSYGSTDDTVFKAAQHLCRQADYMIQHYWADYDDLLNYTKIGIRYEGDAVRQGTGFAVFILEAEFLTWNNSDYSD